MYTVSNASKGQIIASHVSRVEKLTDRMIGLLRHENLERHEGLWIEPCNSIHTFFMRFSIDAIFLSSEFRVVRIYQNIQPFRVTRIVSHARSVVELRAHSLGCQITDIGDHFIFEEHS